MNRTVANFVAAAVTACAVLVSAQEPFRPEIPKVWDETAIADMEIPPPSPAPRPVHVSEAYYYSIPELTIYKTYPRVPAEKEPEHLKWLAQQEPVVAFDSAQLKTEADWVRAGGLVFRTPTQPVALRTGSGNRPGFGNYVIRVKGQIEVEAGTPRCSTCHSQRLPGGTSVAGAPSRNTNNYAFVSPPDRMARMRRLFSTPWLDPDPNMQLDPSIVNANHAEWRTEAGGISDRMGSGLLYPIQIPSLIGLKDRKYFDHSGRHRHRSIGDLMRYAALADVTFGMERFQRYGDFVPGAADFRTLPDPKTLVRFSDAQLYALALYLYSLRPPANPNKPDALSEAGARVFRREGCPTCHTPPLYTSNKLIPVDEFAVPPDHRTKYDIRDVEIGLDPYSTMKTRRGTGYYKVPSLKDVWMRPVLEHNGSIGALEEWFDERRLEEDFVGTGFRGHRKSRAVPGHPFGLQLSAEDKKALIAFLRTL
jgi:mono/diheme cytochrome c family protein